MQSSKASGVVVEMGFVCIYAMRLERIGEPSTVILPSTSETAFALTVRLLFRLVAQGNCCCQDTQVALAHICINGEVNDKASGREVKEGIRYK